MNIEAAAICLEYGGDPVAAEKEFLRGIYLKEEDWAGEEYDKNKTFLAFLRYCVLILGCRIIC